MPARAVVAGGGSIEMSDIFVISQEALQAFTKPGLDLQTGQIIELYPAAESVPVQLELFGADEGIQGGHNAAQSGRSH